MNLQHTRWVMWILKNSNDLLEYIQYRSLSSCHIIKTFDFSTLYTTIPHSKLKDWLATFQQHLHMQYISLSWYDIPELVVPIRISLIEGCCKQWSYWSKVEVITSEILRSPPWLGWPLWNICVVTNDQEYVPLVVSTPGSFPHSWLITGFVTRLIRRVPLVQKEQFTILEHMSSPQFLVEFVLLDL